MLFEQTAKRILSSVSSWVTKLTNTWHWFIFLLGILKIQILKCTEAPSAHWNQLAYIKQRSRTPVTSGMVMVQVLQPSEGVDKLHWNALSHYADFLERFLSQCQAGALGSSPCKLLKGSSTSRSMAGRHILENIQPTCTSWLIFF